MTWYQKLILGLCFADLVWRKIEYWRFQRFLQDQLRNNPVDANKCVERWKKRP